MKETYLIMRKHKAINPYESLFFYNIPRNPNYYLLKEGARVIVEMEVEGAITFVGFGTLGPIMPNPYPKEYREGETMTIVNNFTRFYPPRANNSEIRKMLSNIPKYYWIDSIREITEKAYHKIQNYCRIPTEITSEKENVQNEDNPLLDMFNKNESNQIEYKSTMRKPMEKDKKTQSLELKIANEKDESKKLDLKIELEEYLKALPKELEHSILKSIAAFSNSIEGGTLYIGIDDWGHVVGIENDYSTLREDYKNVDGWLLTLSDIVKNSLGLSVAAAIKVTTTKTKDGTVAEVKVPFSPEPVFCRRKDKNGIEIEEFYARVQNKSERLKPSEQNSYIKSAWK